MSSYADYIKAKMHNSKASGIEPDNGGAHLYPFQRELVHRALRAGRYALFTDTGTGKTAMQIDWARQVSAMGRVIILAPLAVAMQTVDEAKRFGVGARYLRADDGETRIVVTNYDMLSHFEPGDFTGVVLDESSILKSFDGAMRNRIICAFRDTPYRLAATATPAPNDHMELGNHSEFLSVKTRSEMLSEFFVHDGSSTQAWRLKGHARDLFWQWVCGWASMMSHPSDLGYKDDRYTLPPVTQHEHVIEVNHVDMRPEGYLFAPIALTLSDQRAVRRSTTGARVALAKQIAESDDDHCIVWCELNAESDAVTKAIDGAVQVQGSDTVDAKVDRLMGFSRGDHRVLVTKPSIAGFGMNWQHCARVVFLGASHSFEQTYQAIRRCWRFGQLRHVHVHFIRTEQEEAIIANYRRKELAHGEMIANMTQHIKDGNRGNRWNTYAPISHINAVPHWMRSTSNKATTGSCTTEIASK